MFSKISDKVAIYTAIDGNFYYLKKQRFAANNCHYYCFTNNNTACAPWKIKKMNKRFSDKRLNYKWYKMMPHLLFPDYEYSLWLDSLFVLNGDIRPYIENYLADSNIAMLKHHAGRDCLYEEGKICVELKLSGEETTQKQLQRYRDAGYPESNGLNMTGIMFRRHHEEDVKKAMEDWFEEVTNGSRRDQISFNYIVWKNKLNLKTIYEEQSDHSIFNIR